MKTTEKKQVYILEGTDSYYDIMLYEEWGGALSAIENAFDQIDPGEKLTVTLKVEMMTEAQLKEYYDNCEEPY